MTKKKVEVDEDILKDIIVGEIPVFGREMPAEESTGQPEPEAPPATELRRRDIRQGNELRVARAIILHGDPIA